MKIVKILLIILAVVLVVGLLSWYFTSFNPSALTNTLAWWADRAATQQRWDRAVRLYTMARNLDPDDPGLAMDVARAYESSGNYTKTEYTLTTAIRAMPDETALYVLLSRVYVAQDKLMDAVELLDNVSSAAAREELAALRPQAPVLSPASGAYDQVIEVTVSSQSTVYLSATAEYPSVTAVYTGPVTLTDGTTTITAVCVGENGLVSPAAAAAYTVGAVVQDVHFADPALESSIRLLLGKAETDPISSDELWTLTELTLPAGLTTLADLSLFRGLTTLTAQDLTGIDLSPLAELPALTTLTLTGCRVTEADLTAIGTSLTLRSLTLSRCGVTTLQPLQALTGLNYLDVSDNAIGSLAALADCSELTHINVSGNALTQLDALESLPGLLDLDVSQNPLQSLPALPETLLRLNVSGCGLTNLDVLSGLPLLKSLWAADNALESADGLETCQQLQELDLSGNALTRIDAAAELPALETLRIDENQLTALPDFATDSPLTTLEASYNQLTDVSGLAGLERLNYVNLDYNESLTDLTALESCWTLVQLSAYGCPILVSQAIRLTNSGVIVHYSPDYTREDPDLAQAIAADPVYDTQPDVAEIVVEASPESASLPQSQAAEEGVQTTETAEKPAA